MYLIKILHYSVWLTLKCKKTQCSRIQDSRVVLLQSRLMCVFPNASSQNLKTIFTSHTFVQLFLYSFIASVSPSPTVSMLRVMRVSRSNFLFSLSMATVLRSSGDGFSTSPPHNTCKTRNQTGQWTELLEILKQMCVGWGPHVVDSDDPPFPQQEKGLFVVIVIVYFVCVDEDEVKCFSLPVRHKIIWKKWRPYNLRQFSWQKQQFH